MNRETYAYSKTLMGTCVELILHESNDAVAEIVFKALQQLEDKLTVNQSNSEIMAINLAAGLNPVVVSSPVFALIEQAKKASLIKGSCFNLAIEPLVKLWKIGFNGKSVPSLDEIEQKRILTDPNLIHLNSDEQSVFLEKKGMGIDLGAIAKGYMADMVKLILQQHGIDNALINLGGNILAVGQSNCVEQYWRVGLKKPFATNDEIVGILKVKNKSVVTSGIYERYFEQNGRVYHHILNPLTGYPLDKEFISVSIISASSLEGDIYSTILYGKGLYESIDVLSKRSDLGAIFITRNNQIKLINVDDKTFELSDKTYQLKLN